MITISKYPIEDLIVEVESLKDNIPSFSCYQREEAGYYLYAAEDAWVLPFGRTDIWLNTFKVTLPDNTFGIISDIITNECRFNVEMKRVKLDSEFMSIKVRSNELLPFKIKAGDRIALLSIVPSKECIYVEHKYVED